MRNFILIHEHSYGTTIHPLTSVNDISDCSVADEGLVGNKTQEIINTLGIDFEPMKGECISIEELASAPLNVDKLPKYYLFGGGAVPIYESEGAEKLIGVKEEYTIDYQLVEFDPNIQDVNELLLLMSGWENYLEISKNQYEEIIHLETER